MPLLVLCYVKVVLFSSFDSNQPFIFLLLNVSWLIKLSFWLQKMFRKDAVTPLHFIGQLIGLKERCQVVPSKAEVMLSIKLDYIGDYSVIK